MSDRSIVGASLVISATALGCVVLLVASGRGGGSSATAEPPSAFQQVQAPVQSPQTVPPAGATTTDVDASPTPAATAPQTSSTANPMPSSPSESTFWQLIDQTRAAAGADTGRQSELLKERLTHLSPQAIVEFAQTRRRLDQQTFRWDLWGAAAVIEDGCSDDCFRDFRAYVISLGRGPYERALQNPDSLASVAQNAELGDWEGADDVAPDAYSSVTGNDFPLDDSDLSGQPAGRPIDLDAATLAARYPKLAARFRG